MGALLWAVGTIDSLVAVVAVIILYFVTRRFYPVAYVLCGATYVFLVTYIIDAFELKAEGITVILFLSSLLLMFLGYITSKKEFPVEIKHTKRKKR